jgi:hypothetical protein
VGIAFFFFESFLIIDITWVVPAYFSFIELIQLLLFFTNTGIFIWQIIDVRKLTQKYNTHFEKTQDTLW